MGHPRHTGGKASSKLRRFPVYQTSALNYRPKMARDTIRAAPESDEGGPPYVDYRLPSIALAAEGPLLVPGKPELRGHKAVFVIGDAEVSQFSDEITVNCAPLV